MPAQLYSLQILRAKDVVWDTRPLHSKAPNLYVVIQTSLQSGKPRIDKTPTARRGIEPAWENAIFPLPVDVSTAESITVGLYHDTSMPLIKDRCLGETRIGLDELLESYVNENGAALDLTLKGNISARLIVKLIRSSTDELIENTKHGVGIMKQTTGTRAVEMADRVADFTLNEGVEFMIEKLDLIVKLGDEIAKIHPYAHPAWTILTSVYQAVRKQQETDEQLRSLVNTMVDVYSFVQDVEKLCDTIKRLETAVLNIMKETVECAIFINEYTKRGFLGRLAENSFSDKKQIIDELSKTLLQMKESLSADISLQVAFNSANLIEKVDILVDMEALKSLNPVIFNAAGREGCFPGTRKDVLSQIIDWLAMPSDAGNIFWLHGVAGAGKSAISTSVSEYFLSLHRLGGFLFFRRDTKAGSSPDSVISTIAHGLAKNNPRIRTVISAALTEEPALPTATLRIQFERLLLEPLSAAVTGNRIPGPIIIVLDALDECGESPEDRRLLLSLIANQFPKLPGVFRFFITSRLESDIADAFRRQPSIQKLQLDISTPKTHEDIRTYIEKQMGDIRACHPSLGTDWPGSSNIRTLTDYASGLFIWASTACRFIGGFNPARKLAIILASGIKTAHHAEDLYKLYGLALENLADWSDPEFSQMALSVLGAIVLSRVPLTDGSIDQLFAFNPGESSQVLDRFGCLLQWTPGRSARILHASFSDYLTDHSHSGHVPWFIDSKIHSRSLALGCLRVLNRELRFNICGLEDSRVLNADVPLLSERVSDAISPHLSYASQFWAQHLQETLPDDGILVELEKFMRTCFLYWLEVLSLLGNVSIATKCLVIASNYTLVDNRDLRELIQDSLRFVAAFAPVMSQSVPHIYISALPSAPQKSKIHQHFAPYFPRTARFDGPLAENWSSMLKVFHHTNTFTSSLEFSPDGKRIASASVDNNSVTVWDAETGAKVGAPFESMHALSHAIFSANGKQILCISRKDSILQIWDCETSAVIATSSGIPGIDVQCAALSRDGKRIAIGSARRDRYTWGTRGNEWDPLIHVRDTENGELIGPAFRVESGESWCKIPIIAFSPDEKRVVTGWVRPNGTPWGQHAVRVWDCQTGSPIFECKPNPSQREHSTCHLVAFSPDGTRILSVWSDLKVTIWDSGTGDEISLLGLQDSAAFGDLSTQVLSSFDRKWILGVVSNQSRVAVWDFATGDVVGVIDGHCFALSPDGGQIVTGSGKTVRLWDAERVAHDAVLKSIEPDTPTLMSITFSPNGRCIALGSDSDNLARIIDSESGASMPGPPQENSEGVNDVVFSPDGKQIGFVSHRHPILKVWNSETGTVVTGPPGWRLAFSANCTHVVSTLGHGTIDIWTAVTGTVVAQVTLEKYRMYEGDSAFNPVIVRFSTNGNSVIYLDPETCNLVVWDWHTGAVDHKCLFDYRYKCLAVSPDTKHMVFKRIGENDRGLAVCDAQDGFPNSTLGWLWTWGQEGGPITIQVAFSPDSRSIVTSTNSAVRVWDAETLATIAGPFICDGISIWTKMAPLVTVFQDGSHFVSGTRDGAIQRWEVNSEMWGNHPPQLENGWLRNSASQPMLYVPPWLSRGLDLPWMKFLVYSGPTTDLDLTNFVYGTEWHKCIDPKFRDAK
ncbi:hypothetical protein C8R43DRAFT_494588 [Mycena crocata]|nr:hypothetical protein C8R43DRAFT_494588 [Mycena crocata]